MFEFLKRKAQARDKFEPFVITKDTTMGEMLDYDLGIAAVLTKSGMHCVGCPSSTGESLEMACIVHGLNVDEVLSDINRYMAENNI